MGSPAPVTEFEVNTRLIRNVLKQKEDREKKLLWGSALREPLETNW